MKQRSLDAFLTARPVNHDHSGKRRNRQREEQTSIFTDRHPSGHAIDDNSLLLLPSSPLLYRFQRGRCVPYMASPPFRDATVDETQLVAETNSQSLPELVSSTATTSIVLDKREDFAMVTQKSCITLYAVSSWQDAQPAEPTLSIPFSVVRDQRGRNQSRTSGFSSLAFCGETLFVTVAYTKLPFVDVFDLEDVDEATAEPVRQFDLTAIEDASAVQGNRQQSVPPFALAICQVTDQTAVAGLSDGRGVWLDRRKRRPHALFANRAPNLTLGQSVGAASSSLTAVTMMDGHMLLTGNLTGAVKLWDVRSARSAVADLSLGAEVGSISPVRNSGVNSYRCGSRTAWVTTRNGQLLLVSTGPTGMEVVTSVNTEDTSRSPISINMGAPKAVYCETLDLLLYPHLASNTLLMCDGQVRPEYVPVESDSDDDGGAERDNSVDNESALAESAPHFTTALQLHRKTGSQTATSAPPLTSSSSTVPVRLRASLAFPSSFTIAACAIVERTDTILIGDAHGNMRICIA